VCVCVSVCVCVRVCVFLCASVGMCMYLRVRLCELTCDLRVKVRMMAEGAFVGV
jgi:hypothetical protein